LAVDTQATDTRTAPGRVVSPVLVGRDEQLRRLVTAVTHSPAVVVVEGEAGIGKTRLVTEMAAHPDLAHRLVLTGTCRHIREPFPLGPIVEALHDAGPHLRTDLSPIAGGLHGLLPELADVLPPPLPPLDDRATERHRVFRGLAELVRSLGPTVLVVEDLHWADENSREFLVYLLATLPATLSVVLTYRGEEAGAGVREVTARLADSVGHEHLRLPPLDPEQTRLLAMSILDGTKITAEFGAHLHERSSGLPLAVQELLALLRERGSLIRLHGGRWARRALAELDVPPGVRDLVLERVGRLPDEARTVAEAAAVLDSPVPVRVLTEVGGLPRDETVARVDELLLSGLLAEHNGTVAFRHVLAAQAVYGGIPLGRRQDLHARAAAAVRTLTPVPLGHEAHHLREAGLMEEWMAAAERAARQAEGLGDDAEAVRILEDVLRTAPLPPPRRVDLAVRLGWAACQVLRPPEVIDLLTEALDAQPADAVRGQLHFLIGLLSERLGMDIASQRENVAAAVEYLDDQPELAAWATSSLGRPIDPSVPHAEHLGWLNRTLETVPAIGDPVAEIFVLGKVAGNLSAYGDPRWSTLTDTILERTGGRPDHRQVVHAYRSIAENAAELGHLPIADRLLEAGMLASADESATESLSRCRLVALLPAYFGGRWTDLDDQAAELLDEYRWRPNDRIIAEAVAGCMALARGKLDTARRDLPDTVRHAEEQHAFDLLPLPVTGLLRMASAHDEAQSALAATAGIVAVWHLKFLWPLGVRALPALTEAMVTTGRRSEADELVTRVAAALEDRDAPLAAAAVPHARGHLATDPVEAATLLLAAATAYDPLGAVYEAAQARESAAANLFTAGETAAEPLRAAIEAFETLGAAWDLDRAAQLARRQGMTVAGRYRRGPNGYGPELTPREREVADLAATGLTNQQIGRELFLSPRTVEKHLASALRKLGLRSRAALASHLDSDGAPR
jgi:DNA-binding CsgD family transcriptional regulator